MITPMGFAASMLAIGRHRRLEALSRLAAPRSSPQRPRDPLTRLLRLEGLAAFAAAATFYAALGGGLGTFALLFFAPDLAMAGYALGPRSGAIAYNMAHSYVGPALLGLVAAAFAPALLPAAAVWAAHIGFDRALGYGLKRSTGFADTHLGRIGRAA